MKVFLCEYIHEKAYEMLKSKVEIISDYNRISEADAIINRNLYIDRDLIERCKNLKVIGIHGTGLDGVDYKAAKERGITVLYVPHENADAVAEYIIALMLSASRKIFIADRMVINDQVNRCAPFELKGKEITGKTFGMVGCGDIALRAAKKLKNGFNMNIVGYSPSLTDEKAKRLGINRCDTIKDVFKTADYVNIGVPLNDITKGMIDSEILSAAKKGCILINTSRGAVINEDDLYEALNNGIIESAACDVMTVEPPNTHNRLVGLPNVIITPHIAANTDEALYRVGMCVVNQIINALEGKEIQFKYV